VEKDPWFWELRGDGEFTPPEISSIGEGWVEWEGPLAAGPSREGEIFVRELVQNFVDAAREHKVKNPSLDLTPSLSFNFVELSGKEAKDLAERLGLKGHSDRFQKLSDDEKSKLRIGKSGVLEGDFSKLRLLVVRESSTTGMYGPWEVDDNAFDSKGERIVRKMRSAMLATEGDKTTQGLGAYGEGKRAVIASSAPRAMLVYTCFAARELTGAITRRFLGATYWRNHTEGQKSATGLALFGKYIVGQGRGMANRPKPLSDDEADQTVTYLDIPCLDVRNATNPSDLGTTQVFIEPAFGPEDVKWALERNWWPLIEDGGAHFEVFDHNQQALEIAPDLRPEIAPFLEAYRTARGTNPPRGIQDSLKEVVFQNAATKKAGQLSLTSDVSEGGWSWKDRETNRNLVALVRDGMLIEYEPFPRGRSTGSPPFIRGVFVTDSIRYPEAEKMLRMVEPPLHNYWNESNPKLDAGSIDLARRVYSHIATEVREFRKRFREVPPPNDDEYEIFGKTFNEPEDFSVVTPPPIVDPPKGGEGDELTIDPWMNQTITAELFAGADGSNSIFAKAARALSLKHDWEVDQLPVRVKIGWQVMGDKQEWGEVEDLLDSGTVMAPKGFEQIVPGIWSGTLSKEIVTFKWSSSQYPDFWTVRPFAEIAEKGS
jgi:hypothetical protein